jgi:hypothetical protein
MQSSISHISGSKRRTPQKIPKYSSEDLQRQRKKLSGTARVPARSARLSNEPVLDEELMRLNQLSKRYGINVRNRPLVLDKSTEDQIEKSKQQGRMDEKFEIISLLRKKDISAVELFAYLGLKHGFGEKSMIPYIYALKSLEIQDLVKPKWAAWTYMAVKNDLIEDIERILLASHLALSSAELVARASCLKKEEYALKRINKACNILDAAGKAVKLPPSTLGGSGLSMWIHKDYEKTVDTVPSWNVKWWILKILSNGDAAFSGIVEKLGSSGIAKTFASELADSILIGAGINSSIDSLIDAGLIKARHEPGNRRSSIVYSLAYGVDGMLKKPYLDELLNMALKAEYRTGAGHKIEKIAEKMLRCARILMEHQRTGEGACRVAGAIDENEKYIEGVLRGSYPWTNVSEKNIGKALPLVEQKSKESAAWLRKNFFPNITEVGSQENASKSHASAE